MPPLAEDPQDAREGWKVGDADTIIYRLGLHALPVPGLPSDLAVDDVTVDFVPGPIKAQHTQMRQRYGLPIVFDKAMRRLDIGDGELLAVLWIEESPVPDDLEAAFNRWRAHALAAAGMVAAVLDERVVGKEQFEDAVLLLGDQFVGGADMRGQARSYLPFDVTAPDRAALEQLSAFDLSESQAAARAARLYRRAALEGPTADAYAMLWVAAECFSSQRSPSRKEIEQSLIGAGLDPASLPLHVGLLIDLRGKVQHHGLEGGDRLQTAYYEMEAVVRSLIRQHAGIVGGWWAASDNPAAFTEPFDAAVAALHDRGTSEWHEQNLLPVAEAPEPLHLPRRIPNPASDPRLQIGDEFGEAKDLVAGVILDALEWQEQDAHLEVRLDPPDGVPPDVTMGANATTIWIAEERIKGVSDESDPGKLVNLVWDLHALVGAALAQQAGLVSRNEGTALIEAIGAWSQYQRFVLHGEFEASALQIPAGRDQFEVGKLAGWAAAGDRRSQNAVSKLSAENRRLVESIIETLREAKPGPPLWILEFAAASERAPE
jgi:hypothetical protein